MIVGYHIIFGAYGFWLPNDPRGSWSTFVGSWELTRYGSATKTTARHSVAYAKHDHGKRIAAKKELRRPAVKFSGLQARAVGRGFGEYCKKSGLQVWACAILPDHVHLVVGKHRLTAEKLTVQLKAHATTSLIREGLHPFHDDKSKRTKKCFAQRERKVYLDPEDVQRAIRYVEQNPIKEGFQNNVGFLLRRIWVRKLAGRSAAHRG